VLITFLVFFAAITIGAPIAFSLGFAGAAHLVISGQANLNVLPTILFGAMDSFPLLAIPFFILAGDLMGRSGMLDRLIAFVKALVGPLRGGLAHVTIAAAMAFGGISGVSLADCAAIGKALIPGLVKEGYPRSVAAAITAGSCVMGAIIPPSVGMLIIAYLYGGRLSIGRLFLSGAIPGVLIGLTQMGLVALVAKRRGFPVSERSWSLREVGRTLPPALVGLGTAVIVIGGIVSGFFTPTEAGAVAVAYALVCGSFGRLRLGWRDVTTALLDSAKLSGVVFIMVAASQVLSWLLVINMIPQQLGPALQPFIGSPETFLLAVMALIILLGFPLEGVPIMIMLVPVVAPLAPQFGVEPHHLALVILMSAQFAILTPPVALAVFMVAPIAGCSLTEATVEMLPYAGCILLVTLAVIFVPALSQWLPRVAGY
jgi:TRAP-type transport system large permease protein